MTIKEHIDAARAELEELRDDGVSQIRGASREFAIALTALEDAAIRTTRGICKREGVFNEADMQKSAVLDRARGHYEVNAPGNTEGFQRSQ